MSKGLTITELRVQNIKKITALEIDVGEGTELVTLTGDNAQGKSSVLDAILMAITGSKLDDPIHHGAKKGTIRLKISGHDREFTIQKTFTAAGGASLKIVDADGNQIPAMQTFLNSLIGQLAFDPLAFTSMKAKEQVETLRACTGLDTSKIDAKRAELYAERTVANRKAKEAATLADNAPKPTPGTPDKEVSAAEALEAYEQLRETRTKHEEACRIVQRFTAAGETANAAVEAILMAIEANKLELKRLEEKLAENEAAAEKTNADWMEANKAATAAERAMATDEQLAAAKAAIDNVEATNREVRKAADRAKLRAEATKADAEAQRYTDAIEKLDEQRQELILAAKMPVEGLELTEDHVLYNGCVFEQLSTAEQVKISTMVAMAQNPELRIILIREGALLNRANKGMIATMAKDAGYQVWMEVFQEDPSDCGIHIEDGAISHIDGKPVEKEAPPAPEPVEMQPMVLDDNQEELAL